MKSLNKISDETAIAQTQAWVRDLIVAHNICPFARRELERQSIRYQVVRAPLEEALAALIEECQILDNDADVETTLLIYPDHFKFFEPYLDFVDLANELLVQQGYEGVYQLATFHPHYCFADAEPDDAANYTNRAPFPMLHLLREASLETALQFVENPEQIPERNIEFTRELGTEKLKEILAACKR